MSHAQLPSVGGTYTKRRGGHPTCREFTADEFAVRLAAKQTTDIQLSPLFGLMVQGDRSTAQQPIQRISRATTAASRKPLRSNIFSSSQRPVSFAS